MLILIVLLVGAIFSCKRDAVEVPLHERIAKDLAYSDFIKLRMGVYSTFDGQLTNLSDADKKAYVNKLDSLVKLTANDVTADLVMRQLGYTDQKLFTGIIENIHKNRNLILERYPALKSMSSQDREKLMLEAFTLYQAANPSVLAVLEPKNGRVEADPPCWTCRDRHKNCRTKAGSIYTTAGAGCAGSAIAIPVLGPFVAIVCAGADVIWLNAELNDCDLNLHDCLRNCKE